MVQQWLNFSGAAAMLVPKRVTRAWHGIFLPDRHRPGESPDFIGAGGSEWFIWDDFDFSAPKTDYDRLCARLSASREAAVRHPMGGADALVINNDSDSFGWWAEERVLVTNASELPTRAALASSKWVPLLEWEPGEHEAFLMNSAAHGEQLDDRAACVAVDLGASRLHVAHAMMDGVHLFRFVS